MSLLLSGKKYDIPGACRLSCRIAGEGTPVLLLHGIGCTSSMVEMLPLFDALQSKHQVFALDLPGFGGSDRGPRAYTPRLMTDALHRAAAFVRVKSGLRARHALDAVAFGKSCEFLARAAVEDPVRWGRLALVSPTGINGPGQTWRERFVLKRPRLAHTFLHADTWSQAFFELLTSPGMVRRTLRRSFGSRNVDHGLIAESVKTAAAAGARFAPLAYLSGRLESADIQQIYAAIEQPVWVTHGSRGLANQFRHNPALEAKPNWRLTAFGSGQMPHFQNTHTFVRVLTHFLRDSA